MLSRSQGGTFRYSRYSRLGRSASSFSTLLIYDFIGLSALWFKRHPPDYPSAHYTFHRCTPHG